MCIPIFPAYSELYGMYRLYAYIKRINLDMHTAPGRQSGKQTDRNQHVDKWADLSTERQKEHKEEMKFTYTDEMV